MKGNKKLLINPLAVKAMTMKIPTADRSKIGARLRGLSGNKPQNIKIAKKLRLIRNSTENNLLSEMDIQEVRMVDNN